MALVGYEWRGVLAGAYANDKAMSKMVDHLVDVNSGAVLCKKVKPERMSDIGSYGQIPHCPECERRASKPATKPEPAGHVWHAGKDDYRVRVSVGGKKRDVGGFRTREQAKEYASSRSAPGKRSTPKRRAKTNRSKKKRVGWRYRLKRAWRRLMKRRRK